MFKFKKDSGNYNRYSISAHYTNGKYFVEVDDNVYDCALQLSQEVIEGDVQETKIHFDTNNYVKAEQDSPQAGALIIIGEWEAECFAKMYQKAMQELAFLKEGSKGQL